MRSLRGGYESTGRTVDELRPPPGRPVSAGLSAAEVEALAKVLFATGPTFIQGGNPKWEAAPPEMRQRALRQAEALLPTVAALVAQAASERERALRERVEAVGEFDAWLTVAPGVRVRVMHAHDVRAALSPEAAS